MQDEIQWYEIHDNLCLTASWMANNGYKADDLAYFVEKPYKYESEFNEAKAAYDAEIAAEKSA